MPRRGENIRRRKDGRWEGRYIKGYDSVKGKAKYASLYGKTYSEVKNKLNEAKFQTSIHRQDHDQPGVDHGRDLRRRGHHRDIGSEAA